MFGVHVDGNPGSITYGRYLRSSFLLVDRGNLIFYWAVLVITILSDWVVQNWWPQNRYRPDVKSGLKIREGQTNLEFSVTPYSNCAVIDINGGTLGAFVSSFHGRPQTNIHDIDATIAFISTRQYFPRCCEYPVAKSYKRRELLKDNRHNLYRLYGTNEIVDRTVSVEYGTRTCDKIYKV